MEVYELLKQLETELTQPVTRKDTTRLTRLIHDEFEEISATGKRYDKQDILALLPGSADIQYELFEFTFMTLSEHCILVKYKASKNGVYAYRSSIWTNTSGDWQILHHQASLITAG